MPVLNSPRTVSDQRFSGFAARLLALACALNLNDVFYMVFGIGQAVSVGMLVASVYLVLRCGKFRPSVPFALLILAILSYLVLASLATVVVSPEEAGYAFSRYFQTYGASILLIWGMTGYVVGLSPPALSGFLRFVRNALLVSALSVWASPILYQFYVNVPLDAYQRMGGFFGNPNEAAFVSALAVVLVLAVPIKSKLLQIAALIIATGAIVLTFSKSGMTVVVLVLAWHYFRRAKGLWFILALVSVSVLIVVIQNLDITIMWLADRHIVELSHVQIDRLLSVNDILEGQINEETSTGRTFLWGIAAQEALSSFPFGNGLGSGHHIVGGIMENGVWQGAHNTFLMLWMEGGVVPLLLLIACLVTAILSGVQSGRSEIVLACLLVLLAQMVAGHTPLALRYHNLMFAISLGLLVAGRPRLGVSPGPRSRPAPGTWTRWQDRHPAGSGGGYRDRPNQGGAS